MSRRAGEIVSNHIVDKLCGLLDTTEMNDIKVGADLWLREVHPNDTNELYSLINENRSHIGKWLPWVSRTTSVEDIENFIRSAQNQIRNGQGPTCCVSSSAEIVGICGLKPIDLTDRFAELGYWLAEPATGQGVMTQCARALIEYSFEELDLNRIEIRAAEKNDSSRAIAERLGFTLEGILREIELLNGCFVNHAIYSMLKAEWHST